MGLKSIINKKKLTYYTGNPLEKKAVSRDVPNEKMKYREKIEMQYSSGDLQAAWQGIKTMASINQCANEIKKPFRVNGVDDWDLPNIFNSFFSCFEKSENESLAP